LGFEGGQMPMQRRMPKFGFRSKLSQFAQEIRLFELNDFEGEIVNLENLCKAKLIKPTIKTVKIILNGEIKKKLTIGNDIKLTKGAKEAIIAVGGKVES
jgi:large subunit ribosomal protein L15